MNALIIAAVLVVLVAAIGHLLRDREIPPVTGPGSGPGDDDQHHH